MVMLSSNHALAQRLEEMECFGCSEYTQTHRVLYPEIRADSISVAGGEAFYCGPTSPISQAMALGMNGEVKESEVDKLEEFYQSRNSPINVEFCPYADPSLLKIFSQREYTMIENSNMLIREFNKREVFKVNPEINVYTVDEPEYEEWAQTIAKGFLTDESQLDFMLEIGHTFVNSKKSQHFVAKIGDQFVGGGVLLIKNEIASLYGTSTIPQFRNRGVQSAIIEARLAYAVAAGCEIAMVTTMPGSNSQRNLERQGFRVIYTRSKLFKK
jgi:ribosomal protein S18 acetylase RimI-like enzyme